MKDGINIREFLEAKGIQPSFHRIKIYEYLLSKRNHPSVDEIYQELYNQIPTLSKTTIYNTLNLFAEKGLVTVLTIDGKETRYDAITESHAHFKCILCGRVYDVDVESDIFKIDNVDGHEVQEAHLYFKGVCKNCQNKRS